MAEYMGELMRRHKRKMKEHGKEESMPKEKYEISEESEEYSPSIKPQGSKKVEAPLSGTIQESMPEKEVEQLQIKTPKFKPTLDTKTPKYEQGIPAQKSTPYKSSIPSGLAPLAVKLEKAKVKSEKKEDVNAVSSEGEKFKVEKTPEGFWKETGVAKEKYLKSIGKLKSKKGK